MKRIIALFLVVVMLAALTGCSADDNGTLPLEQTAAWLRAQVPEPAYGSVGGEWMILGLARSELGGMEECFESYGESVAAHTAQVGGVLHAKKYTEYARVILAWTAIGRDASDVGGFNLLVPLADFDQTVFQGINGPVFALLALDIGGYEIPENESGSIRATRDMYVDYILSAEVTGGGWALTGGEADVDITAMALQALAKYRERPDVAQAVERAVAFLSQRQNESGGFTAYEAESSESIAQVIVALTELGIAMDDERFVKNGNTLLSRLLEFRTEDGGFCHTLEGDSDQLATEQAFYALVAIDRMEKGKTSLYSMK